MPFSATCVYTLLASLFFSFLFTVVYVIMHTRVLLRALAVHPFHGPLALPPAVSVVNVSNEEQPSPSPHPADVAPSHN